MPKYSLNKNLHKHKARHGHMISEDEQLLLVTSLSKAYLIQKFFHFLLTQGIIFPILTSILLLYLLFSASKTSFNYIQFLMIGILLAILYAAIKVLIIKRSTHYILTTKRVLIKKGFLNHTLFSAPYDKITQIEIDQSLFERLVLKHGTVRLSIAGLDHKEIDLEYLDSPLDFKRVLENLIHQEKVALLNKQFEEKD